MCLASIQSVMHVAWFRLFHWQFFFLGPECRATRHNCTWVWRAEIRKEYGKSLPSIVPYVKTGTPDRTHVQRLPTSPCAGLSENVLWGRRVADFLSLSVFFQGIATWPLVCYLEFVLCIRTPPLKEPPGVNIIQKILCWTSQSKTAWGQITIRRKTKIHAPLRRLDPEERSARDLNKIVMTLSFERRQRYT